MPHAGHFCGASLCRFRLNTYVNGYIISTVGEYVSGNRTKFEEIGLNRLYETMVFEAVKSNHKCCPYEINLDKEVDFEGYNDAESATKGHYDMIKKWKDV